MFCKGLGRQPDIRSGATGNTPTGDRAGASRRTSQEAVAKGGRVTAGADSNRGTLVPSHLVASGPGVKYRNRTGNTTIMSRMLYPLS